MYRHEGRGVCLPCSIYKNVVSQQLMWVIFEIDSQHIFVACFKMKNYRRAQRETERRTDRQIYSYLK